jgi:hypothetical protein
MLANVPFTRVTIDASRLTSWDSFHTAFAETFGFPGFYGRNLDAWIDCMSSLDAPEEGMSTVHAPQGGIVLLELEHIDVFARDHRELYDALIDCAAFVNFRRVEAGQTPVLALSFHHDARI